MGTMLNQIGFTGEITYFRNLDSCIRDALQAAQDKNKGPSEPTNFGILQKRLDACRLKHPPLYRENVIEPYVSTLNKLVEAGFSQVLFRDPSREGGLHPR